MCCMYVCEQCGCVVCRVPCMRHVHVAALPTFQVAAPAAVRVFLHRLLLSSSSSPPHKILPQTHTYTHVSHTVCGLHFLSSLSSFPICLLGAPKSCGLQREKQRQKPRQRWNNQGKGHRWGLAWGGEGSWRWSSVHLSVICPTLSLPSPLLPGVSHLVPRPVPLSSEGDPWDLRPVSRLSSACASVYLSASARPPPSPCCGLIRCPSLALPIPRVECVWVRVSVCLWLDLSARGSVFLYLTCPPPCSFIKYPSFPSSFSCLPLAVCASVYMCVCT